MEAFNQFARHFASQEGFRLLSSIVNDECKLLQDTKKILDKRITLDEQYARNLQELTASADRIAWPTNTQPIAGASREVFLQWSDLATKNSSYTEQFRRATMDILLKDLIEHKIDSKKFLDAEKHRYDTEHRKALSDLADAETKYFEDAKTYVSKNNELTKLLSNGRTADDSRTKHLRAVVLDKRANLCRAHNDYVYKLREYNFVDQQYVQKLRQLLAYHEEAQSLLTKSWQKLLDDIASYDLGDANTREPMKRMIYAIDPRRCYDEICRTRSSAPPIVINPQTFNVLLLQTSNLTKLEANKFLSDSSTRQHLRQRIDRLTESLEVPLPKRVDSGKDKQISYPTRKNTFEVEHHLEQTRQRKVWEGQLRDELREICRSDQESDGDSDEETTDRLEDQPLFHGVVPRIQSVSHLTEKGDYLVRVNEKGRLVLSILWTDNDRSDQLKDGHFFIHEKNHMFSFNETTMEPAKPTVCELLAYYKRRQLALNPHGLRLIRPIPKPVFMISNDDVKTSDILGKGHFGQVMRGEYRGKAVAVKVLHPSPADRTGKDRENFIREALLLQQYNHKHIVKFLGIAAIRDPMMIVMELIERGSLNDYIRSNDPREAQLIQMCCDIAKGMAYLEKSSVIHRDLAARNCLVDKKGRVKVADFGLSRCLQSDEEYFSQIKEIPIRWWAMEVFINAPYTHKADVWSYGVTAWEVFSKGEIPYAQIQHNHLVINYVRNGERLKQPKGCPPKVFAILGSCWLPAPGDRPTFAKLVELLRKERPLF